MYLRRVLGGRMWPLEWKGDKLRFMLLRIFVPVVGLVASPTSAEDNNAETKSADHSQLRRFDSDTIWQQNQFESLTKALLRFSISFAAFHSCALVLFPEFYELLRCAGPVGHPLLLYPPPDALFGRFFIEINSNIRTFVQGGVFMSLAVIGVLITVRTLCELTFLWFRRRRDFSARSVPVDCSESSTFCKFGSDHDVTASSTSRIHGACGRVLATACSVSLLVASTVFLCGGFKFKAIGFPDIYLGALTKRGGLFGIESAKDVTLRHADSLMIPRKELDEVFNLLDDRTNVAFAFFFACGMALDMWGTYVQARIIKRFLKKRDLIFPLLLLGTVLYYASLNLQRSPPCNAADGHWVDFHREVHKGNLQLPTKDFFLSNPVAVYSEYIRMRDGIELAADIYLPYSVYSVAEKIAYQEHRDYVLKDALRRTREELRRSLRVGTKGSADYLHTDNNMVSPRKRDIKNSDGQLSLNRDVLLLTKLEAFLRQCIVREEDERNQQNSRIRRLPTYLEVTRYNRRLEVFWPLTLAQIWGASRGAWANIWSWQTQEALTANDYVVVVVDTRGTGASFGWRPVDISDTELADTTELVKWTKSQWFSNGRIAGGGISYDGIMGLSMAANGGVDAVISLFSPMDIMSDLVAPGGMICHSFLSDYTSMTSAFELTGTPKDHLLGTPMQFPIHAVLGFTTTFGRVLGVQGREHDVDGAIASHAENWKMTDKVRNIQFHDDKIYLDGGVSASVGAFGITEELMSKVMKNQVSVYFVGGFCDSATARGATRFYTYMQEHSARTTSLLILGGWTHGGRRSCVATSGGFPCFEEDMYADIVRFLDCRLSGRCWGGIEHEKPVHFWQIGEDRWQSSSHYPPRENMDYLHLQLTRHRVDAESTNDDGQESTMHLGTGDINCTHIFSYLHNEGDVTWEHTVHDITQRLVLAMNEIRVYAWCLGKHLHQSLQPDIVYTNTTVMDALCGVWRSKRGGMSSHVTAVLAHALTMDGDCDVSSSINGAAFQILGQDDNAYVMDILGGGLTHNSVLGPEHHGDVTHEVDYYSTSGTRSRWTIAQHPFRLPLQYGNRLVPQRPVLPPMMQVGSDEEQTRRLMWSQQSPLSWTTKRLQKHVRLVGAATLEVELKVSGCTEVTIFAYIEDVDVDAGYSHYVSEGQALASQRRASINKTAPIGSEGRFSRSYLRDTYRPLKESGDVVTVVMPFEPVSWTFKKGHAIRLSVTGSDVDNFHLPIPSAGGTVLPTHWTISVGRSNLQLSVQN